MSKFTGLCGKLNEKITLVGGDGSTIEIELKMLSVEDFSTILPVLKSKEDLDKEDLLPEKERMRLSSERTNIMIGLIKDFLKRAEPDATDAEIGEVCMLNLNALTDAMTRMVEKATSVMSREDKKKLLNRQA